ncbi:MAG TPA: hypothetical protein DHV42_06060 [Lachnospiraceae bacterium]|nr:hypothetical protein [Lachnospiraceae bacterium]
MIWFKDLYVGRLMAFRRNAVVAAIEKGSYPSGVYVILLPESESSQLEIMPARELRHAYVREHCRMIVGIAQGKTEAQSIVERLAGDVYAHGDDISIREWLIGREKTCCM